MKEQIIATLRQQFMAGIAKHKTNIQILLDKPQAIPEHSDFIETIELELDKIAEYQDKLEALQVVLD